MTDKFLVRKKGYNDIVLKLNPSSNIVKYNGEVLNSKSSVLDTSTVKGEAVHGITIDTVNHKNGSYDRTMILSVSSLVIIPMNDF